MSQQTIYDCHLGKGGFLGADFSSSPVHTDPRRLCECINLWHDYSSEPGGYLESFPGFRKLAATGGCVHALFGFAPPHDPAGRTFLLMHAGTKLYAAQTVAKETALSLTQIADGLADADSCLFAAGEQVGILDGTHYYLLSFAPATVQFTLSDAKETYIPLTYENEAPLEQRNALSQKVREGWQLSHPQDYAIGTPGLIFDVLSEVGQTCRVSGIAEPRRMVCIPAATVIGQRIFRVVEVGDRAFQNDNTLEMLSVEEGVERLGRYAFNTCLGLHTVTLPDSVTGIGKGCFAGSAALAALHIGQNTEAIGDYAFYQCAALASVTYTGSSEEWTGIRIGTHNEPLTALTPACESLGRSAECCLRLCLHEKCTALDGVFLDGIALPDTDYSLTGDTAAVAGKTYYRKTGQRYVPESLTAGTALGEGLYEKNAVYYESVFEGEGSGAVVSAVLLYADHVRLLFDRRAEVLATLSQEVYAEVTMPCFGTSVQTAQAICTCRAAACFDGRIFLTGSPNAPGVVFFSHRNRKGKNDPAYFGVCNFMRDGVGAVPNAAISASADTLYVYKGGQSEEGTVFCHRAEDTGDDLLPRIYPSVSGVSGAFCVGAACNFADDPVFLSAMGLEATRASAVTAERSLYHRSTRVDTRLAGEDLPGTRMIEWQGYLLLLCPGGHIYMADSRLVSSVPTGGKEYEWLYLEDVGSYTDDLPVYRYASARPQNAQAAYVTESGAPVLLSDVPDGLPFGSYEAYAEHMKDNVLSLDLTLLRTDGTEEQITAVCSLEQDEEGNSVFFLLCASEERCGGTFHAARVGCAVGDRLFLGTGDGSVLCANTDLRTPVVLSQGERMLRIPRTAYSVCGHRYLCAAVTAADCAGAPHLTKNTRRDGTVIDTKALPGGRVHVRIRSDREGWKDAGSYTEGELDFADLDLGAAVFADRQFGQAVMRERCRRFVYKQYALYSDEYQRPFGFGEISYRYTVAGRIKNR